MGVSAYAIPKQEHYPPFVLTEADQARWDLSYAIAAKTSADNEPDGRPNSQFVWGYARTVFFSELPTGDPSELAEEAPEPVQEARRSLQVGDEIPFRRYDPSSSTGTALDRADLLAELARVKPGPDADEDAHWAHVGRVCDLFDELFGNPDEIELGADEGKVVAPGDGLSHLEEGFANVVRRPYVPTMHPRDRLGKWSQKLNGLRAFAKTHRVQVKKHLASALAGASLHHRVARADNPGGALHTRDLSPAGGREAAAGRLKAHANEARNREGLRGARQQAVHVHRVAKGHAIAALAYMYGGAAEEKLGPFSEPMKDAAAAYDRAMDLKDSKEAAHAWSEAAHKAAEYAVEHRHELHAVVASAAHVARHIARAKGLSAADDTEPDAESVELADWAVESVLA